MWRSNKSVSSGRSDSRCCTVMVTKRKSFNELRKQTLWTVTLLYMHLLAANIVHTVMTMETHWFWGANLFTASVEQSSTKPSRKGKERKPCKCGFTSHSRVSFYGCPLNKKLDWFCISITTFHHQFHDNTTFLEYFYNYHIIIIISHVCLCVLSQCNLYSSNIDY